MKRLLNKAKTSKIEHFLDLPHFGRLGHIRTLPVTEQLGTSVFPHQKSSTHQYDHCNHQEMDHQSSLPQQTVKVYLNLCLKMYGKKYIHEVALGNKPSRRHELK